MNTWKSLRCLCVLLFLALPVREVHAETNTVDELLRIDQRIQFIEANLIKLQGERFRARHELEYGDNVLSPKYQAAKAKEKEMIALRKEVDVRLLATDPSMAAQEAAVKELNARLRELRELDEAIGREISSAANTGNTPSQQALEQEKQQSALDIRNLETALQQAIATLVEKRRTVTETDPETARLVQQLNALESEHQQAIGEVKDLADSSQRIKTLDAQRQELAAELQELRATRQRLLESAAGLP